MNDLISRQVAIEALYQWMKKPSNNEEWQELLGVIKDVPPTQPEHKMGKWLYSNKGFVTYCSSCGQSDWRYYIPSPEEATDWMPICPKCGADMRGDNRNG